MKGSKSIPVRLSAETARRLAEADEALGLGNKSLLIKLCLEAFLRAFSREGRVVLPMDWRDLAKGLDSRRKSDAAMSPSVPATTTVKPCNPSDNTMPKRKRGSAVQSV